MQGDWIGALVWLAVMVILLILILRTIIHIVPQYQRLVVLALGAVTGTTLAQAPAEGKAKAARVQTKEYLIVRWVTACTRATIVNSSSKKSGLL